jgi:hypothetical protein
VTLAAGDPTSSVSAWLHDGARLEVFQQDPARPQALAGLSWPEDLLIAEEFDGWSSAGPAATSVGTTSRLVRVRALGALPEGTFLGVLRRKDTNPRDATRIVSPLVDDRPLASPRPPGDPPDDEGAAAPRVQALWLAPLESRDRPGCGAFLTHRIAVEASSQGGAVEAYLVTDLDSQRSALIDARAAGSFGIGRVEACGQGLPLEAARSVRIEIRPVSAAFGVGAPWVFSSDGTGTTDPARVSTPPEADAARVAAPFPVPGAPVDESLSLKSIVILVMVGGASAAVLLAFVVWVVLPRRKRKMIDVRCPACARPIPVDALDPKTDGFFCPACGASGFWNGKGAVVHAQKLAPEADGRIDGA